MCMRDLIPPFISHILELAWERCPPHPAFLTGPEVMIVGEQVLPLISGTEMCVSPAYHLATQ